MGSPKFTKEQLSFIESHALAGDVEAQYMLGRIYGEIGPNQNWKRGHMFFEMAANNGHVEAQMYCGYDYEMGEGVEVNIEKAIYYYKLAARAGNEIARAALWKYDIFI